MIKICGDDSGRWAQVNVGGELLVCLCEKTCLGHASLKTLQDQFPGLHISIRNHKEDDE